MRWRQTPHRVPCSRKAPTGWAGRVIRPEAVNSMHPNALAFRQRSQPITPERGFFATGTPALTSPDSQAWVTSSRNGERLPGARSRGLRDAVGSTGGLIREAASLNVLLRDLAKRTTVVRVLVCHLARDHVGNTAVRRILQLACNRFELRLSGRASRNQKGKQEEWSDAAAADHFLLPGRTGASAFEWQHGVPKRRSTSASDARRSDRTRAAVPYTPVHDSLDASLCPRVAALLRNRLSAPPYVSRPELESWARR
jgi:hypothetical protein